MSKNDIATLMNGIMTDPGYTKIFSKPTPQLNKTASVKEESKVSMSQYEVLVRGLSKISEMLDNVGLEKAATYTLLSLEDVVANSGKISKAESCSDCILCDLAEKEDKDEANAEDLPERWETIEDKPELMKHPEIQDEEFLHPEIMDNPELVELRERMKHPEIQDKPVLSPHYEIHDEVEIEEEPYSHIQDEAYPEIQDRPAPPDLSKLDEYLGSDDSDLEKILRDIEEGKIESGELERMEASKAAKSQSSLLKLANELKKSLAKKESKKGKKLDPKAKTRNKPAAVFDDKHPKVKDKKDHFPIDTIGRARNALARANQFDKAPEWWSGSLKELKNAVVRAVHAKYPSIKITEKAKD